MNKRQVNIAAIALSLALVTLTVVAGISVLAHWDMLNDARQAQAARMAPATYTLAPYTFDGTRIVMR
jgi:hypothetical protein